MAQKTLRRSLVVFVFCYLILAAVGSIKGCMSVKLPAHLTADELAKVQQTRFDFTVGMERLNSRHSEDEAPLIALRGTGLFKSLDYIDRLSSPPDLIVRGDTINIGTPVVPILTIATLGVFPTLVKERRGYEFSFHAPGSDGKEIEISAVNNEEAVLGWVSGFLNMSGDWTEQTSIHSQRFYDRLALDLAAKEEEIRRLVEKISAH